MSGYYGSAAGEVLALADLSDVAAKTGSGTTVVMNSGPTLVGTSPLVLTQTVATTGSPILLTVTGGAHTTLTASTEAIDVKVNLARTVQFATGALATQRAMYIQAPTYGFVGASTLTTAATLAISGAPAAGTNATITNAYALQVEAGISRFDGAVYFADGAVSAPSMSFSSETPLGFYRAGASTLCFVDNSENQVALVGPSIYLQSDGIFGFTSSASDATATVDTKIMRAAASSVNIGGHGNGQFLGIKSLTELTTIAAAATTDTTIQIPANSVVLAVTTRVTTVIPTAATFDVGVAGATTRYGTGVSTAADTTTPGTIDGVRYYSAAAAIRVTPNLTPADNSGRLRVTIWYYDTTPATS